MPYTDPEKAKAYRLRIKEREKVRLADAYKKNREVLLARRKLRYLNSREVELARNRAWSARNKERHRELCRRWAKDNPLAARALVARRRARLKSAEGFYTAEDINLLLQKQRGLCAHCQCDISARFDVDHIVPILKGGSNWPDNLQLLCGTCNRSKSDKTMEEWLEYQGKQATA